MQDLSEQRSDDDGGFGNESPAPKRKRRDGTLALAIDGAKRAAAELAEAEEMLAEVYAEAAAAEEKVAVLPAATAARESRALLEKRTEEAHAVAQAAHVAGKQQIFDQVLIAARERARVIAEDLEAMTAAAAALAVRAGASEVALAAERAAATEVPILAMASPATTRFVKVVVEILPDTDDRAADVEAVKITTASDVGDEDSSRSADSPPPVVRPLMRGWRQPHLPGEEAQAGKQEEVSAEDEVETDSGEGGARSAFVTPVPAPVSYPTVRLVMRTPQTRRPQHLVDEAETDGSGSVATRASGGVGVGASRAAAAQRASVSEASHTHHVMRKCHFKAGKGAKAGKGEEAGDGSATGAWEEGQEGKEAGEGVEAGGGGEADEREHEAMQAAPRGRVVRLARRIWPPQPRSPWGGAGPEMGQGNAGPPLATGGELGAEAMRGEKTMQEADAVQCEKAGWEKEALQEEEEEAMQEEEAVWEKEAG
jgi:hypothetical protein